jgi:hypothetical protein
VDTEETEEAEIMETATTYPKITDEVTTAPEGITLQTKIGENNSYNTQTQQAHATQRRAHNGGKGATSGQTGKWCANCRKPTHNRAQCWGSKKKTVNDVNEEEKPECQDQIELRSNLDTIQSLFQSKNLSLVPPKHRERIYTHHSLKKKNPKQSNICKLIEILSIYIYFQNFIKKLLASKSVCFRVQEAAKRQLLKKQHFNKKTF